MKTEKSAAADIRMPAQGIAGLASCTVQLFSHMHGVEASGAVGLFVRTKVIIPNFICHNCTFCVQLRRLASDAKPTHGLVAAEMKLSQVQLSALRIASTCVPLRQWSCFQCYAVSMAS